MMDIKLLGISDNRTQELFRNLELAIAELQIKANIELVEDVDVFLAYRLTFTPALVIDERVIQLQRDGDYDYIRTIVHNTYLNKDNNHAA